MTLITFVQNEREILWERLNKWHNARDSKMTKDKYLQMCFELKEEPDPERCPPDFEDFPTDVQKGIVVYGKLGDRLAAEIGYIGKDLTSLPLLMDLYDIEFKDLFIETILLLDQKMIEKSASAIKREHDKAKRAHGK